MLLGYVNDLASCEPLSRLPTCNRDTHCIPHLATKSSDKQYVKKKETANNLRCFLLVSSILTPQFTSMKERLSSPNNYPFLSFSLTLIWFSGSQSNVHFISPLLFSPHWPSEKKGRDTHTQAVRWPRTHSIAQSTPRYTLTLTHRAVLTLNNERAVTSDQCLCRGVAWWSAGRMGVTTGG